MKHSISAKQNLNFRIIIERPSYRLIGILSNIIYGLFVVDLSYEYQNRNVSNIVRSLDISVASCTILIVNRSIHGTQLLVFLHLIHLYVISQNKD